MEKKPVSPWLKGLVISLITIAASIALQYAGKTDDKGIGMIPVVLLLAGIIWACISYSKQMDAQVTFGNVFYHGFQVAACVTIFMIIYTIFSVKILFPEQYEAGMAKARAQMEKDNKLTKAEIDDLMDKSKKFFVPLIMIGVIFLYGILGTIFALIGGLVAKKNPNPTPFNQS